ncbi:Mur ligase domain-containing protein [Niabella defluvii]|nr:Mur ligase domain-containing protein [Niabella sp. I65]
MPCSACVPFSFLLRGAITKFDYLQQGIAIVLIFIGAKMLAEHWISQWIGKSQQVVLSLLVIVLCITGSIVYSVLKSEKECLKKKNPLQIHSTIKVVHAHATGYCRRSWIVRSEASPVVIHTLLTDSRKLINPDTSLFFALTGPRRDGHLFIPELYKAGLRYFVVSEKIIARNYPGAVFLVVDHVLTALQKLAAFHRSKFTADVIGITGSNGKTIVKEWIYQLLQADKNIVRSPKSYNSQIGVPLSVWEMDAANNLAIFEAGISQPGEMQQLASVIQPTIGVITNIGSAHSEGFKNNSEKLREKLLLFKGARIIIANGDNTLIRKEVDRLQQPAFYWGKDKSSALRILAVKKKATGTEVSMSHSGHKFSVQVPFTDEASIENAVTACAVAVYLKTGITTLQQRCSSFNR